MTESQTTLARPIISLAPHHASVSDGFLP